MENIKELVNFVNKQKITRVEVMGNPNNYSGKMKELYNGIIEGKYKTDEDAIIGLYGEKKGEGSYKKLKYRLQNRLINTVFFIDVNKPNFNDSQKAFYNCQKAVAAIDILLGRGARKTAIELAEKTLRQAMKYEYTEICVILLKKLSRHYGGYESNKKKFEEYSKLTLALLEVFNAETIAEQYYTKSMVYLNSNTLKTEIIIEEIVNYSNHLKEFLEKVDSNRFLMMCYLVFSARYELVNDNLNVLKICDQVLKRFNGKEDEFPIGIYLFTSKKIDCLIKVKQYKKAEYEILKALKLIPEGKINWLNTNEKYMRMCIHSKNYQKAYEIFDRINSEFGFQPAYKKTIETWKIYEAYYNFFIENGKIELSKSKYQPQKKFRLKKFLNEVPTYSKDKRGLNIPILIIQILFHLQQIKYDPIIDKVEALNAYCYRYLKKDDTFRSNCFIKMLLLLPKCNFNRIAVDRKSQNLFNKLKSVPLEIARQSAEIEIVPYEDLWEIVLGMLDNKFHRIKVV